VHCCKAQGDSTSQYKHQLPEKYIDQVTGKINSVDKKLSKQTLKALRKFEKLEAKLQRKIAVKDSTHSEQTLDYDPQKIKQLTAEFNNMPDKAINKLNGEYNAYLDTLKTSFKFLQQKGGKVISQSKAVTDKLKNATSKLNVLEGKLQKAEEIKKYLRERKQQLKAQCEKLGFAKQLKKLDKVNYYYGEYLSEYKGLLKDRKKLEQKAMSVLYSTPLFKKFAEQNSVLASLFRLPVSQTTAIATTSLNSAIQTRASVQQIMQTSVAAGGPNAMNAVQQQIQNGQAELNKLKDKIAQYGSTDAEIPSFKPNTEKTKSIFKRLEYGATIQFGKANKFLPNGSDIAVSLGYMLQQHLSAGVAVSYKLGLANGWNNIKLTNEGIGLRSYVDWKIPTSKKITGGFYLSGGYEQNYNSSFKNIDQLKKYNAWQSSGLLGVSKKMPLKGTKSVKASILYDFLYGSHLPATTPFIFRTSFNLK
jgi:hypothetical protein